MTGQNAPIPTFILLGMRWTTFHKISIYCFPITASFRALKITFFSSNFSQKIHIKRLCLPVPIWSQNLKNRKNLAVLLHELPQIGLKSKNVLSENCSKWKIFRLKVPSVYPKNWILMRLQGSPVGQFWNFWRKFR